MAKNDIRTESDEGSYLAEFNVDIPLKNPDGLARCNVFRPQDTRDGVQYPVLMTMGPYGKDIPYSDFHPNSWKDVPDEQKSKYSAWETPDPKYWTSHGYVVVRVDERGLGQSPGFMDTMSATTASDFAQCIEWAADQPWCDGKVGLLGISYYAGSQWRVAARRPKGLTCIVPWEGMTDYLRDRCRQGGIYSNGFIKFWWNRQVVTNQYGVPGRAARKWGPDTIEGDLSEEELKANRRDQVIDNAEHRFSDDPYYGSREYQLSDIQVPLLSVANLGGITLHMRGNVVGYLEAGSENKWLFFISGRHDIPFYLPEYVALQKSFLDAWLKGKDNRGWLEGPNAKVPAVELLIRKGNPGFNNTVAERTFTTRQEREWPLARTQYVKFYLHSDGTLNANPQTTTAELETEGLTGRSFKFKTAPFDAETEVTGHILAQVVMGVSGRDGKPAPKEMDVMVTLRHIDPEGREVFYTGSSGDNVPVCKGHLRATFRKINSDHPRHKDFLPYRHYASTDVQPLDPDTPYELLIELWPTSVTVSKGGRLIFEVSPKDEQGSGKFTHDHPLDRNEETHGGKNKIFFGDNHDNWLQLPIIPSSSHTAKVDDKKKLKIVIVGAGIAGLTAALALRGDNHEITILEQTRMKSEIGAAIHVAPNASKILRRLGVDMIQHRATLCGGLHEYGSDGRLHMKLEMNPEKVAGAPWTLNHRVDLHSALKNAVLDHNGKGPTPTLRGEARVEKVDCDAGIVTLSQGEEVKGDVIIGADGIHSPVRQAVIGETKIARPSGLSAYRCLFTRDKIEDVPEAVELLDARPGYLKIIISDGQERIIMYPCRDSTTLNVVAVCSDEIMNEESSQSWSQKGHAEDMIKTFSSFPQWVQTLLGRAEAPGLWQLRDQDPLERWVKGRCIIIGDAAHAMLPHQGQGGAQAIEDGEALGAFLAELSGDASGEDINKALQEVFDVRHERASIVQLFSRSQAMPPEESEGGHVTLVNSKQFAPWNWKYDGAKDWQQRQRAGTASLKFDS